MTTANEKIRDALVKHQVDILRTAKGMAQRLVALFNKGEANLRAVLRERIERAARTGFDRTQATKRRLAAIEDDYREIMAPNWDDVGAMAQDELTQLSDLEVAFFLGITAAALPVTISASVPDSDTRRRIVTQTPINGTPLASLLAQWTANDRRRVMEQVRIGLLFKEAPVQISRRIFGAQALGGTDGVRNITRRGALTLANTTMNAIANAVRHAIYTDNKDIIKRQVFVATLDSRTTPICQSLDGKIFEVNKGPIPPLHVNCRSLRVPTFDGDRLGNRPANAATESQLEGLRGPARRAAVEKLVGRVPAKTTYAEWLARQSAAFQDEVLGPSRGKLFRRGDVSLDAFVDQGGHHYTLAELRDRLPSGTFEAVGL